MYARWREPPFHYPNLDYGDSPSGSKRSWARQTLLQSCCNLRPSQPYPKGYPAGHSLHLWLKMAGTALLTLHLLSPHVEKREEGKASHNISQIANKKKREAYANAGYEYELASLIFPFLCKITGEEKKSQLTVWKVFGQEGWLWPLMPSVLKKAGGGESTIFGDTSKVQDVEKR